MSCHCFFVLPCFPSQLIAEGFLVALVPLLHRPQENGSSFSPHFAPDLNFFLGFALFLDTFHEDLNWLIYIIYGLGRKGGKLKKKGKKKEMGLRPCLVFLIVSMKSTRDSGLPPSGTKIGGVGQGEIYHGIWPMFWRTIPSEVPWRLALYQLGKIPISKGN